MRRISLIISSLLLLTAPSICDAQVSNPSFVWVATAPSGSCKNGSPIRVVIASAAGFGCNGGTWTSQWPGGSGSFSAGGDLTGTSSSQQVTGILTHALPTLATGFLNWSGTAWAFSPPFSLTTTGTSGAATFSSGTLNIPQYTGGGGGGTVTSFSAGTLSPLFTTSVATPTATPALSFTLVPAAANSIFGNFTGSTAAPTFSASPVFSAAGLTNFPTLNQNTTGTAGGLTGSPAITVSSVTDSGLTSGNCVQASTGGLLTTTGSACGAGGGGNTTSTSLTTGTIPVANGANSIINSLLTDNGTTLSYTGTGGVTAASYGTNGATPGSVSLTAGTGSIPALPANSAGFAAPVTGGTAYLFKPPATITAGILHAAAPATGDGVNESALTSSAVSLTADVSGNLPNANLATQTANTVLGSLTATTPSGLAVPSCAGAANALIWTSGTGFGCNTISAGAPANYTTSGPFTSIGPATQPTPAYTLSVYNPVATTGSTRVWIQAGAGQSSDLMDLAGSSGATVMRWDQYGNVNQAAKYTNYNGQALTEQGFAPILASTGLTYQAQTASLSSVAFWPGNFYLTGVQFYHVSCNVDVDVAATGTVAVNVNYTSPRGARTVSVIPAFSLAVAGSAGASIPITAAGNNAITLSTTLSITGATYDLYCWLSEAR